MSNRVAQARMQESSLPRELAASKATEASIDAVAFEAKLDQIAVPSRVLRSDPAGREWLPADLRRAVERDPACAACLRRHVELELALFDDAGLPESALFTAKVLDALPEQADSKPLLPRVYRRWVLVPFYALAAIVMVFVVRDGVGLEPLVRDFHRLRHSFSESQQYGGAGVALQNAALDATLGMFGLVLLIGLLISASAWRQSMLTPRS